MQGICVSFSKRGPKVFQSLGTSRGLDDFQKIGSQKKAVVEGTEEWDLLYRKYYGEELRRMGVAQQVANR